MGVKERKERDKLEMREKILQSAHRLFTDRGFSEVSIRNIADSIEYSPATIYLYFKDKNEIFYELHNQAFRKFNEEMAFLQTVADPFDRLIKMGEKYIEFMYANPNYYNIMFLTEAPMQCEINNEDWEEGFKALSFLEGILVQCQQQGRFQGQDPQILAFTIWSYMHGMCSIILRDRMKMYPEEDQDKIRNKSFELFARMLEEL